MDWTAATAAWTVTFVSDLSSILLDVFAYFLITRIAAHQTWQARTVEVF